MGDDATVEGFFIWLVFVLLIALIPAGIAKGKGRSFFAWWVYGILLWIVALIHSIALPPVRVCPHCAEAIKPEAKVCPHCQREVGAEEVPPAWRACPHCAAPISRRVAVCKECLRTVMPLAN